MHTGGHHYIVIGYTCLKLRVKRRLAGICLWFLETKLLLNISQIVRPDGGVAIAYQQPPQGLGPQGRSHCSLTTVAV